MMMLISATSKKIAPTARGLSGGFGRSTESSRTPFSDAMAELYLRGARSRNSVFRPIWGLAWHAHSANRKSRNFSRASKSRCRSQRPSFNLSIPTRCWWQSCLGTGDRQKRQQGDQPLFKIADTPHKMVALGEELDDYIKTIGLYRNKAKNVIALASGSGMAAWCRARARN